MKNKASNRISRLLRVGTLFGASLLAGNAAASMGNLGTTYGVLPSDVASAQALSMFNTQVSAVYYNPAYLVKDSRGELTMGFMHAQPQLRVNSKWSDGTLTRSGTNVLNDTPSQQILLGMKTDLTSLTKYHKPSYLAVMIGMEKYGQEMMAFDSQTSQRGQFFQYGRKPLFLVIGGASTLWRGISAGFSTRTTLHSTATMNASSTMGGKTTYEQMEVSAKPKIRPIFGLNIDWGKTICPDSECWLDGFETAFAYRAYSNSQTTVASNITIPNTVPAPGVALAITTLDAYQPNIYSMGLLYAKDKQYRIGVTVEMQQWSDLEEELKSDTIKDQAVKARIGQLQFRDIIVPRLGANYWFSPNIKLTAGVAWMPTPLDSNASLDVNYFDADKIVAGLGLSIIFEKPPIFAFPLRLDIGYQYQQLQDKEFDLYTSKDASIASPRHYETVEADGNVNVFSASLSLKF